MMGSGLFHMMIDFNKIAILRLSSQRDASVALLAPPGTAAGEIVRPVLLPRPFVAQSRVRLLGRGKRFQVVAFVANVCMHGGRLGARCRGQHHVV